MAVVRRFVLGRAVLAAGISVGSIGVVAGRFDVATAAIRSPEPQTGTPAVRPPSRDYFKVPAAALTRQLGAIPSGTCAPLPASQSCQGLTPPVDSDATAIPGGNWPLAVPGLGVPLGGVGAGALMVNQDGTFGPWNFGQEGSWETRILTQAAFHFREQVGGAAATTRTLAVDGPRTVGVFGPVPQRSWGSPLPAWHPLKAGDASYSALYPFGWMRYRPFRTDVSMRFFSPIVAGEDRRTSLPVAYFDVRLANHTGKRDRVSAMFTMPNAGIHDVTTCNDPNACGGKSVRTGLSSRFDSRRGVRAVTLSADSPHNTPDTAHSQWTIAVRPRAGESVTDTTSWNAAGNGADVYRPFARTGRLPDRRLDQSASAGAIAVSATLRPGQVTTIPFALSWDFPQVHYAPVGPGDAVDPSAWPLYMRRYTDFYGARETRTNHYVRGSYPFHQALRIATDALVGHRAALSAVLHWWRPIATSTAYPKLLRTAALNQLYQLVMNSSFWDGGLVARAKAKGPDDWRPHMHWFQSTDNGGGCCGIYSSWDVDSYGWVGYTKLFPNLERDRLLVAADAIKHAPQTKATPGNTKFLDWPGNRIMRWYGFAKLTRDRAFLRAVYPAMKRDVAYMQGAIVSGTHLPFDGAVMANTYDVVPQLGPGLYDSSLYLLALEATIAAGNRLGGDAHYVAGLKSELAQAKSEFERMFWDPLNGWYRFTATGLYSSAVALATFYAQHAADVMGLPDIDTPSRHHAQLAGTFKLFEHTDASGTALGAPNLMLPAGVESPDGYYPFENSEVWTGTNYIAAADYILSSKRFHDPGLEKDGMALAKAIASQVWQDDGNGFVFDPPESWIDNTTSVYRYPAYTRNFAIWDLMNTINPIPDRSR